MNRLVSDHTAQGSGASTRSDPAEDAGFVQEAPPAAVGQSERRMQVRAYNHWAGLLGDRALPPLSSLDPQKLAAFADHGVIIDLAPAQNGANTPANIAFLGSRLAEDCGQGEGAITTIANVPERSLLSRLTGQYAKVLTNNAPLSFEGEFANQQNTTVQYRGILLPFSDDDSRVEQLFGVINWREVACDRLTRSLHKEVKAALQSMPAVQAGDLPHATMADWADGPAASFAIGVEGDQSLEDGDFGGGLYSVAGEVLTPSPASLSPIGPEYALVMIRRNAAGQIELLGEIPENPALLDQAARALATPQ